MLLALAGYAQYRIPEYTAGRGKILLTRASLVGVGVAFGAVSVISASGEDVPGILVFLIGFGLVHTPAAIILFFKREQGAGKS